ncbi:hypothetical protein SAMN05444167_1143 [Terriglobus roseus]|uniref:Uncharacterized protein n=1 Tax=Terriglobus roseus TaxID=392734 RepID=A0A1G7HN37_9BACT|nr:hypothetical protein SAMN05444167_1143 [Terriglobus roseus]
MSEPRLNNAVTTKDAVAIPETTREPIKFAENLTEVNDNFFFECGGDGGGDGGDYGDGDWGDGCVPGWDPGCGTWC